MVRVPRGIGRPGDRAAAPATGRMIYSPAMVRIGAGVYAVFALWWLAALLVGPRPMHALVVGPGLLAVGAVVYLLFWRPAVLVDDDGIELRNVLRDVRVPWSRLEGVDTRFTLTLLADDARYQSWAAPAPGRPSLPHPERHPAGGATPGGHGGPGTHTLPQPQWTPGDTLRSRSSQDLRADSGAAAFMVQQRWVSWQESARVIRDHPEAAEGEAVQVHWNVWPFVVVLAGALTSWLASAAGA